MNRRLGWLLASLTLWACVEREDASAPSAARAPLTGAEVTLMEPGALGPVPREVSPIRFFQGPDHFLLVWGDHRANATRHDDLYAARVAFDGGVLDARGIPIAATKSYEGSLSALWNGTSWELRYGESTTAPGGGKLLTRQLFADGGLSPIAVVADAGALLAQDQPGGSQAICFLVPNSSYNCSFNGRPAQVAFTSQPTGGGAFWDGQRFGVVAREYLSTAPVLRYYDRDGGAVPFSDGGQKMYVETFSTTYTSDLRPANLPGQGTLLAYQINQGFNARIARFDTLSDARPGFGYVWLNTMGEGKQTGALDTAAGADRWWMAFTTFVPAAMRLRHLTMAFGADGGNNTGSFTVTDAGNTSFAIAAAKDRMFYAWSDWPLGETYDELRLDTYDPVTGAKLSSTRPFQAPPQGETGDVACADQWCLAVWLEATGNAEPVVAMRRFDKVTGAFDDAGVRRLTSAQLGAPPFATAVAAGAGRFVVASWGGSAKAVEVDEASGAVVGVSSGVQTAYEPPVVSAGSPAYVASRTVSTTELLRLSDAGSTVSNVTSFGTSLQLSAGATSTLLADRSGNQVRVRQLFADGGASAIAAFTAALGGGEVSPVAVASEGERWLTVWEEATDGGSRLQGAFFSSDAGAELSDGGSLTLLAQAGLIAAPRVVYVGGQYWVAYEVSADRFTGVDVAMFQVSPQGVASLPEVVSAGPGDELAPHWAVAGPRRAWLEYTRTDPNGNVEPVLRAIDIPQPDAGVDAGTGGGAGGGSGASGGGSASSGGGSASSGGGSASSGGGSASSGGGSASSGGGSASSGGGSASSGGGSASSGGGSASSGGGSAS
ncbi:MAG: hypothetical protein K1X89_31155, partial [Myxococcaceae bacterium]|nr:hypothetical protein [Myxococcaceae bacterium]